MAWEIRSYATGGLVVVLALRELCRAAQRMGAGIFVRTLVDRASLALDFARAGCRSAASSTKNSCSAILPTTKAESFQALHSQTYFSLTKYQLAFWSIKE